MPNGLSTLQKAFLPPPVLLTPPAAQDAGATATVAHAPVRVATAFGLSDALAAATERDAMAINPCHMTASSLCSGPELEGINAVQRGLSQKVNFEVALLRGVEAGRARAIDNLIKELSGLADRLPEDGKKKA